MGHTNKILRRESCFTLSNLFADEFYDHKKIVDSNIIDYLIERMTIDEILVMRNKID